MNIYHLTLILSASLRSLFPILINLYPVSIFVQTFLRFFSIVFIFGLYLYLNKNYSFKNILSIQFWKKYLYISLLQVFYVFSAYYSFLYLSPGVAISIYYLFPIILYIFEQYFHTFFNLQNINIENKENNKVTLFYFSIALIGVFITQYKYFFSSGKIKNQITFNILFFGFFMAFLSAILEALLTIELKYKYYDIPSEEYLFNQNLIGIFFLMFLIPFNFINQNKFNIIKIFFFNLFLGVIGSYLLIISIKNISTKHYSSIIFIGVIMAYIFGYIFFKIKIEWYHILGTIFILFAIYKNLNFNE